MIKKLIKWAIPSKFRQIIKLAVHQGDKFNCPFCGYNAKDLSQIGLDLTVLKERKVVGAGLRNGGCYKCGSTDRERLIYMYLKDVVKIFDTRNIKILHLAPEINLSSVLSKSGFEKYICGDLFTKGYRYPDYVLNMNVLNIPYDDKYFDLVICNHLLEHIPNDTDAMKELFRVLKPNGKGILQVPISNNSETTFEDFSITNPKERELVFGQFDHVRIYGQDYENRLSSVGFKVERINISKKYGKQGLCVDEDIFIGTK
jgi:SAM-dependent methyltransferase